MPSCMSRSPHHMASFLVFETNLSDGSPVEHMELWMRGRCSSMTPARMGELSHLKTCVDKLCTGWRSTGGAVSSSPAWSMPCKSKTDGGRRPFRRTWEVSSVMTICSCIWMRHDASADERAQSSQNMCRQTLHKQEKYKRPPSLLLFRLRLSNLNSQID